MEKQQGLTLGLFLSMVISLGIIISSSISILVLQFYIYSGFTSSNLSLSSPCQSYLIAKYNNYYKYILSVQSAGVAVCLILSIFIAIYMIKNQWNNIKQLKCCGEVQSAQKQKQKAEKVINQTQKKEKQALLDKQNIQHPINNNCLQTKSKLCLIYIMNSICLITGGTSFGYYLGQWFDWKSCISIDFLVYIYFSLAGIMLACIIIMQAIIISKIKQVNDLQMKQKDQKIKRQNEAKQKVQITQMVNQTNRPLIVPIPIQQDQLNDKRSFVQKIQKNIQNGDNTNQNWKQNYKNDKLVNSNMSNNNNTVSNSHLGTNNAPNLDRNNSNNLSGFNNNNKNDNTSNTQLENNNSFKNQQTNNLKSNLINQNLKTNKAYADTTSNYNKNSNYSKQYNQSIINNKPDNIQKVNQKLNAGQQAQLRQSLLRQPENIYGSSYNINVKDQTQKIFYQNQLKSPIHNQTQKKSTKRDNFTNYQILNNSEQIVAHYQKPRKPLKLASSIYSFNQIVQVKSKPSNSHGVTDIMATQYTPFKSANPGQFYNKQKQQNQNYRLNSSNISKNSYHQNSPHQQIQQRYQTNRNHRRFQDNEHQDDVMKINANKATLNSVEQYQNYVQNKHNNQFQSESSRYHTIRKLIKNSQIQQQTPYNQIQQNSLESQVKKQKSMRMYENSPFVRLPNSNLKQSLKSNNKFNSNRKNQILQRRQQDQIDSKVIQNAKMYLRQNNYGSVFGQKQAVLQTDANQNNYYRNYKSQEEQKQKTIQLDKKSRQIQLIKTPKSPTRPFLNASKSMLNIMKTPKSSSKSKNIFSSKQKREMLLILKNQGQR